MLDRKKILTFTKSFEKQGQWVVLPFALLSQVKQEGHLKVSDVLSTAASAQESGKTFPKTNGLLSKYLPPGSCQYFTICICIHCYQHIANVREGKKVECSLSDKRRKQRNPSHCTEMPGLIISWIRTPFLPPQQHQDQRNYSGNILRRLAQLHKFQKAFVCPTTFHNKDKQLKAYIAGNFTSSNTTENNRAQGYAELLEVLRRSQKSSPVCWAFSQCFLLASSILCHG